MGHPSMIALVSHTLAVDNITQDIPEAQDPVIFKIDVARVFCSLHVDPVDAI